MIDLEKLKKLNAERTQGPWSYNDQYISSYHTTLCSNLVAMVLHKSPEEDDEYDSFWCKPGTATQIKNGEFIAELANSLPAIIAELDGLRKVAEAARNEALSFNEGYCNQKDCDRYYAAWEEMQKALSALDEVSDVK